VFQRYTPGRKAKETPRTVLPKVHWAEDLCAGRGLHLAERRRIVLVKGPLSEREVIMGQGGAEKK